MGLGDGSPPAGFIGAEPGGDLGRSPEAEVYMLLQ